MPRRIILAFASLAALLLPIRADAEPLTLSGGYQTGSSGSTSSTPKDLRLELIRNVPAPGTVLTQAVVPGVFPSNDPQIWEITEANAATFGLDWGVAQNALDEALIQPDTIRAENFLGNAHGIRDLLIVNINNTRVISFDLQRIELELTYWVNLPILNGHRNVWRIIGDATIVPEPPLGLMATAISACLEVFVHRRRKY